MIASSLLLQQLLAVNHSLADVEHIEDLFPVILSSAQEGLQALAGAIFIPDHTQQHLVRVAAKAQREDVPSIWQDGPLQDGSPAAVSFIRQAVQYFPAKGDLLHAYPDLERQTGQTGPVASAVIPIHFRGQSLGVLVLDFEEPHDFTQDEGLFLQILASLSGQVLTRLQLTGQIRNKEQLLRSVVERCPTPIAVGTEEGQLSLINDAYLDLIGQTRAAFERDQIDWRQTTPLEAAKNPMQKGA